MILATLPLRLYSVANLREHWREKSRRTKAHRNAAVAIPVHAVKLPCAILLVRIAPRALDSDNLASACKALRDGIADRLGIKDNDPRCEWRYGQEKGRTGEYAVRVEAL